MERRIRVLQTGTWSTHGETEGVGPKEEKGNRKGVSLFEYVYLRSSGV